MTDNNQDRSQDQGQSGIDRDTEQRNRENETGQEQGQQLDQDKGQAPSDQSPAGEGGFVGSQSDQSSDYLTKGEQDFAAEGQGAQDSEAGESDIETGQSQDKQSDTDDGSDSNR